MTTSDYPEFIDFKERNTCELALRRIGQALVAKRAQFLFGAGMSRDSGLPLGADLAKALLREFFPDLAGGDKHSEALLDSLTTEYPFEAIVQAVGEKPGCKRDDLTVALKKLLIDPQPKPHDAHRDFLSLLGVPPRMKAIFTTNYDELLERALGPDFAAPITEENANEIDQAIDDGKIPVIHLRGKLDGKYQITEPEIASGRYQSLKEEFRIALHTTEAFVFVGFSLVDPDFRKIYLDYLTQLAARNESGKDTYFVSPVPLLTGKYSYALGSAIWNLRQAVWLPLDAKTFFAKLRDVVEQDSLMFMRTEVEKKYDRKGKALEELIDQTARLWRLAEDDALVFLYEARTRVGGNQ